MTKVPLFVPFVEMPLCARRSWGMGRWMQRALHCTLSPQAQYREAPRLTWLCGAVLSISNLMVATERISKVSVQAGSGVRDIGWSMSEDKAHRVEVCVTCFYFRAQAGSLPGVPCARSPPCFSAEALRTCACLSLERKVSEPHPRLCRSWLWGIPSTHL